MSKIRYGWIDFMKAMALLAVIADHLYNKIYSSEWLHLHTIFSVSLFVLTGGISSGFSMECRKISGAYWFKKAKGLLVPYFFATLVYGIYQGELSVSRFFYQLLHFNASGPLYYILFYLQLSFAAPLLFWLVKKHYGTLVLIADTFFIFIISLILNRYTNILDIYGGGGRLLGGTYLFLFYMGIVFSVWYGKKDSGVISRKASYTGLALSGAAFLFYELTGAYQYAWSNPPAVLCMIYTALIFCFLFYFYQLLNSTGMKRILTCFELLGKHTLFVFLFHLLFIDIAYRIYQISGLPTNTFYFGIWLLFAALVPPVGCDLLLNMLCKTRKRKTVRAQKRTDWR